MLALTQLSGFGGGSQFPVVVATNTGTNNGTQQTTGTVQLPSGITAGDLLIVIGSFERAPGTITWPAGWTQLHAVTSGPTGAAAYRVAGGTEGASISVSWTTASQQSWTSLRIIGAHQSTAPESATATGNNASPDPPSLTPSWSELPTLWIVTAHDEGKEISAYPVDYTDNQYTNAANPMIARATRNNRITTENPGTFTMSPNPWITSTIAVRPA